MLADPTATATLIGRGDDLAALEAALDHARDGEVVTVLVAGEAGIGKTRLVQEFADGAFAQGARLLTGACVDVGAATLPYGAIVDALRTLPAEAFATLEAPVRRPLATLVPEAGQDEGRYDGDQSGIFGAVLRLLEQLGREAPLVLVVEDVQWADRSTQDLLRFLAGGLRQSAVLLLLTYRTDELVRDDPVRRLLTELGRARRTRSLVLAPLTREQTARQLAALAGAAVPGEQLAAIHARSEGNPFFSEQLLAVGAGAGPGVISATLRDTLLARLDRLPAGAQAVTRVAAAFGRRVEHELLAAVCAVADDELDRALRACVAGHVLVVDDQHRGYRFRHALLQEVALGELLPGERRRLHRRIAELLAERLPRAATARAQRLAEVAYHRRQAGDDAAALAAAVRAARAAEEVHAMAEASRNYDAALELWEDVEDPRSHAGVDLPHLLERAAECRWLGFGDTEISERLRRRAIAELGDDAPAQRRAEYLSRLATTSCYASVRAALPVHEEALALVCDTPTATAALVRARYAAVLMLVGEFAAAEHHALETIRVARQVGAPREEADALITQAVCRAVVGDVEGALGALEQARPFALAIGDLRVVQRFYTNGTHILSGFARYDEAVALATEGLAVHERAGLDRHGGVGVHENAAGVLAGLGRLDEAAAMLGDADEPITGETVCLHHRRAEVAMMRGELDASAELLLRIRAMRDLEALVAVPLCRLQAEVALWREDFATAREAIGVAAAALASVDRLDATPLLALALRVQADGVAAGVLERGAARAEGDRLLAQLAAVAHLGQHALPEPDQQVRVGRAERSRLDDAPDPARWREVVAGWERLGRPYDEAYASWRLAEALAATRGPRDELEHALVAAHAGATAIGSRHLVAAVQRLGRRVRVALPGDEPADGLFPDLTPREREVLGLIADGRTNRQIAESLFITEKTASVHVSNILGKLGAANRGEAAALAHRSGAL